MLAQLKKLIHDCLTENDGTSYCPFRCGGAALSATGIPAFIANSVWAGFHGHWDPMAFGTGFAAMFGGMSMLAAGVAFKARTDDHRGDHE